MTHPRYHVCAIAKKIKKITKDRWLLSIKLSRGCRQRSSFPLHVSRLTLFRHLLTTCLAHFFPLAPRLLNDTMNGFCGDGMASVQRSGASDCEIFFDRFGFDEMSYGGSKPHLVPICG